MTIAIRSGRLPGLIALGILLVLLVGTAGALVENNPPLVSMANPASVYCANAGGTTEILEDAMGNQQGMCTFANGTSCDEWALFSGEGCKSSEMVKRCQFLPIAR